MKSENDLKVNDELIAKYLSGEATPDEAITLNDWLETPENRRYFEGMRNTWNASNPSRKERSVDKIQAWRKIAPPLVAKGNRRSIFADRTSIAIAASLLVAVVAALLYFRTGSSPEMSVLVTADSTKDVTLSDNSRITMYHNTELAVPKEFKDEMREVTLIRGEAFFSIEKSETNPFIVHAGFANIRVIGTEFNVVVRDNEILAGVNEGKVLLYTAADSVFIEKGAAVSMKPQKSPEPVDMNSNTWAYATRKLVFKDTRMGEVIDLVEKTYGRTIVVTNDNIKNCPLTATFNNDPVEKIVHLISESLNLKLEENGTVFILDGEGCP